MKATGEEIEERAKQIAQVIGEPWVSETNKPLKEVARNHYRALARKSLEREQRERNNK